MTTMDCTRTLRSAAACLLLAAALGLRAGPVAAAPAGSPWGADYFPNIALVDQDGRTLRFYDDLIKDKVVAVNFIFTSCQYSCPLETAKLRQVQEILGDRVGRDIFMYSISIDPERDTPAVLKAYAERYRVGPGWRFLTGNEAEITQLRRKLGLYGDEATEKNEGHTMSMIIGNEATGKWIRRSSYDNPKVMARLLGETLFNYRTRIGQAGDYAQATKIGTLDRGEDLFRRRCQVCHTVGAGDALGPDLQGVVAQRDRAWLQRWLKQPDRMLAEQDPLAMALSARYQGVVMPNLGLSDREVADLIDYLADAGRLAGAQRQDGAAAPHAD